MKRITLRIVCLILVVSVYSFSAAQGKVPDEISSCYHPHFHGLIERLSQEGFDLEFLWSLFMDPRADLMPEMMTISLGVKETSGLYSKFLTRESILLAQDFLLKNRKMLQETEKRFHVDKEVIVAILLVESRFGENIGRYRVLPTFTSMALCNSPENLQSQYQILQGIDPELAYQLVEGIARRRADWAYRELKHFLEIIRTEKMDPLEVRGSYSGALGLAQFLPSSYKTYALKSKGFEEWLTNKEGAITSIANYLKSNGWKENLSMDKKRRVIWSYNHSEPYVNTILQIAQKLYPQPSRPKGKTSKNQ